MSANTTRTEPSASDAYVALLRVQALVRVLSAALVHKGNSCSDFVATLDAILEQLKGPILFCDQA
ncbi:MAG: hypothetical protein FWG17_01825 [Desulfovibrionaceae bacterium]|nr:hypothetical protein [Desulfovibrionaceae bacterium]